MKPSDGFSQNRPKEAQPRACPDKRILKKFRMKHRAGSNSISKQSWRFSQRPKKCYKDQSPEAVGSD